MSAQFEIVQAKSLPKSPGEPKCEGNRSNCPFILEYVPKHPNGCHYCRKIKNDVLVSNWFINNYPEALEIMHTSNGYWQTALFNGKEIVHHFMRWFLSEINQNEILEFTPLLQSMPEDFLESPENAENHGATDYILSRAWDALFHELGSGQFHRRTMAQILDVKILRDKSTDDLLGK